MLDFNLTTEKFFSDVYEKKPHLFKAAIKKGFITWRDVDEILYVGETYGDGLRLNIDLQRLRQINPWFMWLVFLLTSFFSSLAISFLYSIAGVDTGSTLAPAALLKRLVWQIFIFAVFIGPAFETAVFQLAVKRLFDRFTRNFHVTYVVISSGLFGLAHGIDASTIPALTFGIFLSGLFLIQDCKGGKPYMHTFLLHGARNAVATAAIVF